MSGDSLSGLDELRTSILEARDQFQSTGATLYIALRRLVERCETISVMRGLMEVSRARVAMEEWEAVAMMPDTKAAAETKQPHHPVKPR